jgi:DNA polymerase
MANRVVTKLVGIRIDVESRSAADLSKRGVYVYAEDPDFDLLVVRYAPIREYPGGARKLGQIQALNMHRPNPDFAKILTDPTYEKHAYNAAFERITLSRWLSMPLGTYIDPENWHCSAVRANVNGVFGTLDEVAKALRSPASKDAEGKRLIKMFSVSMSVRDQKAADKTCGCQRFHDPIKHPEDFQKYGDYCSQDVVTEAMVAALLPDIPEEVQREYEADQRINDRGFRHFKGLSVAAVQQVEKERDRLMGELKQLTGVANPNSGPQMKNWLEEQDYPMTSLDKEHRELALSDPFIPDDVAQALTLKGEASLSSVSKHTAALNTRCADGRIRGSLQFYGAHTGREAGRGIQPQNLPRYEASGADRTRLVRGLAGSDAPLIAKGTVRSSIVPAPGHVFVVMDYNAIEARCLGWLAGEQWVNDEFDISKGGQGAIYEATAATMFGVNKDLMIAALKDCKKCGRCRDCEIRGRGKVSNLALGYQGGAGALVKMGAEETGIDIGNYKTLQRDWVAAGSPGKFHEWNPDLHHYPELIRLRDLYRDASPMTVRFWKLCAKSWDIAALTGNGARFGPNLSVSIIRDGKHNRMVLPSGRSIWYRFAQAQVVNDRYGRERVDRRVFTGKAGGVGHTRIDTHGGKLTENVTQAVARDVLFDLIMRVEAMTAQGWPGKIVLHVHDEIVVEVEKRYADQVKADIEGLMSVAPAWAPGLAVKGAGGILERYGK